MLSVSRVLNYIELCTYFDYRIDKFKHQFSYFWDIICCVKKVTWFCFLFLNASYFIIIIIIDYFIWHKNRYSSVDLNFSYNQLAYYTLSHKGNDFIHKHVVDAFAIQTANENTKPIKLVYALAGIYLHIVKKYTGNKYKKRILRCQKNQKYFHQ